MYLGVDGKMISAMCPEESAYEYKSSGSGQRPMAGFCEHCNDPWNSTKGGSFSSR